MWNAVIKWVVYCLVWSFRFTIWPYSRLLTLIIRNRPLPPLNSGLLLHSASKLASMIRTKQVKCVAVVEAYIARIQAVNPLLNAVVDNRFNAALEEARRVDELIASGVKTEEQLAKETPLLGVPLTVKESIPVKGLSNNSGRVKPKTRIAERDAEVIQTARKAGLIPLLVSMTPEICMSWETFNNVNGTTNNPYDLRRTCGGSSGGEGSLLASAASVIGLGSDIGGSGRLPAFFCGVYGSKPSPGHICIEGHIPTSEDPEWDNFFSMSPMCRYAEDLPILMKCLIGDKQSEEKLRLNEPVDLKTVKIYYMEEDGSILSDAVNPEIKGAIQKAVQHFKKNFNVVAEKVNLRELEDMFQLSGCIMLRMKAATNIFQKSEDDNCDWNSVTLAYLKYIFCCSKHSFPPLVYGPIKKYSDSIPQKEVDKMIHMKTVLMNRFQDMLGENGVFLYPTFPEMANFHRQLYYKFLNVGYFTLFNVVEMPVVSCPTGLSSDGRPLGFQVAAFKNQDRLTFAVAKELEACFGGWVLPPTDQTPQV